MNKEQILDAIRSLAASQGFYGRLYDTLTEVSNPMSFLPLWRNRISVACLTW